MTSSCSASSCPETAMFPEPEDTLQGAGAARRPGGGLPGPEAGDRAWGLENLGRVAEGVIHDFNNVLTAISGLAELMLQRKPGARTAEAGPAGATTAGPGAPASGAEDAGRAKKQDMQDFARMILQAALSGQGLVKDLRTFARPGGRAPEILDLHELTRQSLAIARGALGGRVYATTSFASGPVRVQGCRSLLQNVFLNLFLNARDAMPRGGRIIVSTETLTAACGLGRPAVRVTVQDTGEGMPPEVLRRIFEPGFTTKGAKGSGLGLANVLHAVESHGGVVEVESAPGEGTAFHVLLPRCG